jgi:hypothetical protein
MFNPELIACHVSSNGRPESAEARKRKEISVSGRAKKKTRNRTDKISFINILGWQKIMKLYSLIYRLLECEFFFKCLTVTMRRA